MTSWFNPLMLSRWQFALTAIFHIIFPVLTIGLSILLVAFETLWLITKDQTYYHHFRFWSEPFLLNFAVGAATGLVMEFEFGTNWSMFSNAGGDVFGHMLGFEGAMSFMLEASFLAVMIFGLSRVPKWVHLLSTVMVSFAAYLSGFWILVANSWMQTPAGGFMQHGRFLVSSQGDALFNPDMKLGVSHMLVAATEIGLFVVGGVSAWYILKKRHTQFFLASLKIAMIAAVLIAPLQIYLGDGAGRSVARYQPAKLAAVEGHWKTNPAGKGAACTLLYGPTGLMPETGSLYQSRIF